MKKYRALLAVLGSKKVGDSFFSLTAKENKNKSLLLLQLVCKYGNIESKIVFILTGKDFWGWIILIKNIRLVLFPQSDSQKLNINGDLGEDEEAQFLVNYRWRVRFICENIVMVKITKMVEDWLSIIAGLNSIFYIGKTPRFITISQSISLMDIGCLLLSSRFFSVQKLKIARILI